MVDTTENGAPLAAKDAPSAAPRAPSKRRRTAPAVKRFLDAQGIRKLPQGVAAVALKSGALKFRASEPGGERGVRRWSPLFATLAEAVEYRRLFLEERGKGTLQADLLTLQQLVDQVEAKLRSTNHREGYVAWFKSTARVVVNHFGADKIAARISAADVTAFAEARSRVVSASSVLHYKRTLLVIAKYSGVDLLRGVRRETWPQVEQQEMDCFALDETRGLLAKIRAESPADADLIGVLFATGWRRSELARLTVQDVDLERARAWIIGKKRRQHVALSSAAVELLRSMIGRTDSKPETPVVHGGADAVSRAFKVWAKKLKEPRLHPHAARHSFVSALFAAGHDTATVKELSRHAGLQSLSRYTHATPRAVAALEDVAPEAPAPKRARKGKGKSGKAAVRRPRLVS